MAPIRPSGPYLGESLAGPHNHYLVGEGEQIDSGDAELAAELVRGHGCSSEPNSRILAFVDPVQAEVRPRVANAARNLPIGDHRRHRLIPLAGPG